MEWWEIITKLLSSAGGIGGLVIVLVLWRIGFLDYLKKNGQTNSQMNNRFDDMENNHLHEIADSLTRIERKLNDMSEHIIYLRAKANSK